jgi:hypothetical protein
MWIGRQGWHAALLIEAQADVVTDGGRAAASGSSAGKEMLGPGGRCGAGTRDRDG